VVSTQDI